MRKPVASYKTYGEAQGLKHTLIEKFPDKTFQVRARKDGYLVVERVWNPSDSTQKVSPSTKRKRNRRGITL